MRTNYVVNAGTRFNVFSQDQLEEMFNGVLHLLQYTGLDVKHEEARDILAKAGAWVDGERVRLPSYMVKDALRKDLSHLPQHGTFSHAIANPPYFDEGKSTPSPNILKAQAHAFGPEELEIWVKVMHTMVALRGTMTIVHRAETLGKILTAMDGRFGDIRIAPLYAREGTAASRVVVQGIKGSRAPMQLLPGLILHSEHSQFTADAEAVLRDGSAWRLR